mgnify:CR=1 FL=1
MGKAAPPRSMVLVGIGSNRGDTVATVLEAVAALEDGAYSSEPVQTQFGWHVILREESRANEPPTLESVRDMIKQRIAQEKLQNFIENLRQEDAG